MPSVLLQKCRHNLLRGYLVLTESPWRLGPFTAAECAAFGNLCDDPILCRLLAGMLRQQWPGAAALLFTIAADRTLAARLVDDFYRAADELYALEESFDSSREEAGPAPTVRIAGACADGLNGEGA